MLHTSPGDSNIYSPARGHLVFQHFSQTRASVTLQDVPHLDRRGVWHPLVECKGAVLHVVDVPPGDAEVQFNLRGRQRPAVDD